MNKKSFFLFVSPSVVVMVLFIALPLLGVFALSLYNSYVLMENSVVENTTVFGTETIETKVPILDDEGNAIKVWEYVGKNNYDSVLDVDRFPEISQAVGETDGFFAKTLTFFDKLIDFKFWGALEFTLLYTFFTTPFILILGFLLALAVNRLPNLLKAIFIASLLLPFIITPVVGSLSVKWLFIDNAVVTSILRSLSEFKEVASAGLSNEFFFDSIKLFFLAILPDGQFYFFESSLTIRMLILFYGIWHVTPFAFIVLYAGLQTVPQDSLEAADVDGASTFDKVRHVIFPHLLPLIIFILLIHVMDAYRVFEPILVFSGGLHAESLQHLTYKILFLEDNYHKSSASALLTILGILVLLTPILRKTYKEQLSS